MNAISYIRKRVFQVTQTEFAALAGVQQSTVSRWENGTGIEPSLTEMRAIRDAAGRRGIAWDDGWFFDVPELPGEAQPAA